jgi:hypothetical protein
MRFGSVEKGLKSLQKKDLQKPSLQIKKNPNNNKTTTRFAAAQSG